nr:hypothetical transcript [Hymenolepis microstoma]
MFSLYNSKWIEVVGKTQQHIHLDYRPNNLQKNLISISAIFLRCSKMRHCFYFGIPSLRINDFSVLDRLNSSRINLSSYLVSFKPFMPSWVL